jgi:hypothetical protein
VLFRTKGGHNIKDNLQKKQKEDFCCWYALLGNIQEAAAKAGLSEDNALCAGLRLLSSPVCRKRIKKYRELLSGSGEVITGLKRLAFGSSKDAAVLAFAEELPPAEIISQLDLFNVSEIKRVKGGGVEVRLFDRLKALEKLFELENSFADRSSAAGLISALMSGEEADMNEDN